MTETLKKSNAASVVIIEDYKLTRAGLRSALNEYETINVIGEAENAEDGIELIKQINPDAVLMDLGLPGMNGFEAAMKIKELGLKTKVIILTSHDRGGEAIAALGAGACCYCLKDISPEDLSRVILDAVKGACWIDPAAAEHVLNYFPKPENISLMQSSEPQDAREQLTERELEVLRHLVSGKSNTEIAKELIVSVHTAKAHVCSILQKLCVDDRVQAAVKAVRENII